MVTKHVVTVYGPLKRVPPEGEEEVTESRMREYRDVMYVETLPAARPFEPEPWVQSGLNYKGWVAVRAPQPGRWLRGATTPGPEAGR